MWRWFAYLLGVSLIAVAVAAVPAPAIVESYVGGSAVHGFVEKGRYFVEPGHGRPIKEVSEVEWRTEYWMEVLWPWSALAALFPGLFLTFHGMGPNWKPPPPPPEVMPPQVMRVCMASVGGTVVATLLFWYAVRIPWATMAFAWVLFCASVGYVAWLYTRFLREQATISEAGPSSEKPTESLPCGERK